VRGLHDKTKMWTGWDGMGERSICSSVNKVIWAVTLADGGSQNKFRVYEWDEEWLCLTEQRPRTKAAGDGYVQSMMDWNAEVLLEAWKRTENRGKAHGWIDRLCGHFMTGIS